MEITIWGSKGHPDVKFSNLGVGDVSQLNLCCRSTFGVSTWGALVFEAGYHPRKGTLKTHPKHMT